MLSPMGNLDNTFALTSQDPAIIAFAWKNGLSPGALRERYAGGTLEWVLELPGGVEVTGLPAPLRLLDAKGTTLDGRDATRFRIDVSALRERLETYTAQFDFYLTLSAQLFANLPPSEAPMKARSRIELNGIPVSGETVFSLEVRERIPDAMVPKRFVSGYFIGGRYLDYPDDGSVERWGGFSARNGFTLLLGGIPETARRGMRATGAKYLFNEPYWLADGYRIGVQEKPEAYRFVSRAGGPETRYGICPAEVYTRGPYFTGSVIPYMERELRGYDGLWANWEPYMFTGKGCFCPRCRAEFLAWSGWPAERLEGAWPGEMSAGGKYHERWAAFRSDQHGRLVKTLHEEALRITGPAFGFVPGVAFILALDSEAGRTFGAEYRLSDYAGALKCIDPWGPYPNWRTLQPYVYSKGFNLKTFVAAAAVRKYMDEHFRDGDGPKLWALPHAIQQELWVTQPEAIAMDMTAFFLHRFEVSALYLFPCGYDNRYFRTVSRANDRIARHEDIVFDGRPARGVSVAPVTPYPLPLSARMILPEFLPDEPDTSMLQHMAFEKDGETLVAVGNYWEKGEVFFTLRIDGLSREKRYRIHEKDRGTEYAASGGNGFTGSELADGILLHAGALRWHFFTVTEDRGDPAPGIRIGPDRLAAAMAERFPGIQREYDWQNRIDEAEIRASAPVKLEPVATEAFRAESVVLGDRTPGIRIVSGGNSALLRLHGLALTEWNVDGRELLHGKENKGAGVVMFHRPNAQIRRPYRVTGFGVVDGKMVVAAERLLTGEDHPELAQLGITERFVFDEGLRRIGIDTRFTNHTADETGIRNIRFGARYHFLPAMMARGGWADFEGIRFERTLRNAVLAKNGWPGSDALADLFEVARGEVRTVPTADFTIGNDGYPWKVKAVFGGGSMPGGIASWDGPTEATPSLEACFDETTLKTREHAAFSMELSIVE